MGIALMGKECYFKTKECFGYLHLFSNKDIEIITYGEISNLKGSAKKPICHYHKHKLGMLKDTRQNCHTCRKYKEK